ncbi:MAG TPA: 23S rRNA (guanosine(2251)-2'-O)-methyltransferase RlmB [Terriglobales bacterium]|jgi:23S rRNA (guanosine2251-2'-O)-methyltransferase
MSERPLAGIHAVREALRAGTPLRFVAITGERQDARVRELVELARAAGVAVRREPAAALDRLAQGERHQGVVAMAAARPLLALEDLLADAPRKLLLACDGIEDPHNLGAILRAACGAGVDGVLLPARRSASLTAAVERVSAGAAEHVRVAQVGNLAQALEKCKAAGWWTVGLEGEAGASLWEYDFSTPTVLVIGAEGHGLHALIRQRCDVRLRIPLAPGVDSLNAATAAAVALFEVARQRR